MARASIRDPEVLRRVREAYVTFDKDTHRAVASVTSSVSQVREWLGREQLAYWTRQLRLRQEALRAAKSDYNRAVRGPRTIMRNSGFDERKAMNKAKARMEEAEEKIKVVKRWTRMLDEKADPLMAAVSRLARLLEQSTPRALGRLDTMLDSLDAYHRPEHEA